MLGKCCVLSFSNQVSIQGFSRSTPTLGEREVLFVKQRNERHLSVPTRAPTNGQEPRPLSGHFSNVQTGNWPPKIREFTYTLKIPNPAQSYGGVFCTVGKYFPLNQQTPPPFRHLGKWTPAMCCDQLPPVSGVGGAFRGWVPRVPLRRPRLYDVNLHVNLLNERGRVTSLARVVLLCDCGYNMAAE